MKKVLIIGNSHDKHLTRFIKGLRTINVDYCIDILDVSMRQDLCKSKDLYNQVFVVRRTFPNYAYKLPTVCKYFKYIDTVRAFNSIACNYKLISIQFLTIQAGFLFNILKKYGAKLIVTPWGSDIYRIGYIQQWFTKRLINKADYVTLMPNSKFGDYVKFKFLIPESKCIPLCFGSDVLDKIITDTKSKVECKKELLGTNDKFCIVVGYNASSAQNHLKIIEALSKIKKQLPSNTIILLPMTYAKVESYMHQVKTKLDELGIEYRIYDSYLTDDEVVNLRKSTDLFIHMQVTDAYSSSLQETLICGQKVINAEWLRYKELELLGLPYRLANFENLSASIINELNNERSFVDISNVLKQYTWSYQLVEWNKLYNKYC